MPRSSAAPWGQLYGCLCSPRRPFVESTLSTAEVDESFAVELGTLPERIIGSDGARFVRASLQRLAGIAGLGRR